MRTAMKFKETIDPYDAIFGAAVGAMAALLIGGIAPALTAVVESCCSNQTPTAVTAEISRQAQ